jgi:hypothetical protein
LSLFWEQILVSIMQFACCSRPLVWSQTGAIKGNVFICHDGCGISPPGGLRIATFDVATTPPISAFMIAASGGVKS